MKTMMMNTKRMIFALVTMLTFSLSASAMSYEQARNEALFLTDKMAYELNLTDAQYEAAYEINLDYLMGVTSVNDVFSTYWERRNLDLSYILYSWQWEAFRAATYFYRPLYWDAGYWHFAIYARYPHRDYFYFGRPHFYATYRGGHAWHLHGTHGYYHGRDSHFRPTLSHGREHFGMRNSFDRGDFRGSRGSSTRITGRQGGDRPALGGRSHSDNRGTMGNRGTDRPNRSTMGSSADRPSRSTMGSSADRPSRNSFGSGADRPSRSTSSGSSVGSRPMSGSSSSRSFSVGSSAPSRSFGSSTPSSGSRSVGSSAPSRSSGGSHSAGHSVGGSRSGGSSGGHGHFGGSRGR